MFCPAIIKQIFSSIEMIYYHASFLTEEGSLNMCQHVKGNTTYCLWSFGFKFIVPTVIPMFSF
jgi:hypothetical protein